MSDADSLLVAAVKSPEDGTIRGAAADELRAWGDPGLAHAVEDDESGPALLKAVKETAKSTGLPVSVNLAWCQFHVLSRLMPTGAVTGDIAGITAHPPSEEVQRQVRELWERVQPVDLPRWTDNGWNFNETVWRTGTGDQE